MLPYYMVLSEQHMLIRQWATSLLLVRISYTDVAKRLGIIYGDR